jgi:ketosteroid isomerase-like protein
MSSLETVRAVYDDWNHGEWGLESFHPEVEYALVGKAAFDLARATRGRDELLDYWRRFWSAWKPGARWEVEELQPLGDEQVLACGRLHVVGRSSGVESSMPWAHLWTVREGLIVRFLGCDDRATALEAAAS